MPRLLLSALLALVAATPVLHAQAVRDSVRMQRHAYAYFHPGPNGQGFECGAGVVATWPDVLLDLNLPGGYSRYSRVATGGSYVPTGYGQATTNPAVGIVIPAGTLGHNPQLGGSIASGPSTGTEACSDLRAYAVTTESNGPPDVLNGAPFQLTDWYAVFSVPNGTPIALFEWDQTRRLDVAFDGSFESGQSREIDATLPSKKRPVASYAWDFGDASTGTGARPTHTYAAAGAYTVTLTVTDDDGQTNRHSKTVTVAAGLLSVRVQTERTPLAVGDTLSLVATVTNTGLAGLVNVAADRYLVNFATYGTAVSALGNRFRDPVLTAVGEGSPVTRAALAPGESFEVRQRYRVTSTGTYQAAGTSGYVPVAANVRSTLLNVTAATASGDAARVVDGCAGGGCANVTVVGDRSVAGEAAPGVLEPVALGAPFPNPARPGPVTVSVELREAGTVRLAVYDALGREAARLADGTMAAGRHVLALDAARLAPGVYVLRLTAGDVAATRRLTVVR